MLGILSRVGILCYRFCFTAGIMLGVLGFLVAITNDTAVYVFYYFFATMFFIIGFLVRYIFFGNDQ